ncbi:MAG: hypothetical protein WDW38_007679 [Sanguina aurantia]
MKTAFSVAGPSSEQHVSPCGCRGSLSHAHPGCTQQWMNVKRDGVCEVCGEAFDLQQPASVHPAQQQQQQHHHQDQIQHHTSGQQSGAGVGAHAHVQPGQGSSGAGMRLDAALGVVHAQGGSLLAGGGLSLDGG